MFVANRCVFGSVNVSLTGFCGKNLRAGSGAASEDRCALESGLRVPRWLGTRDGANYKDGKYGFFLTTPGGSQGFCADESFRGLGASQYLALGRAPSQTLGPFSVLGFGMGGGGTPIQGVEPRDVRDVIGRKFQVAVFLMGLFETEEQAREFGKSLPKLSVE